MAVADALPAEQAEATGSCLRRGFESGEPQRIDYVIWDGDERLVLEGRVAPTDDSAALLILADATERRALVGSSEAIVDVSHALVADEPIERACQSIADILASRLDYPAVRITLRHPAVRGVSTEVIAGDAGRYGEVLEAATFAAGQAGAVTITVGAAACVVIGHEPDFLGSISVADDRPRRLLPAHLRAL